MPFDVGLWSNKAGNTWHFMHYGEDVANADREKVILEMLLSGNRVVVEVPRREGAPTLHAHFEFDLTGSRAAYQQHCPAL